LTIIARRRCPSSSDPFLVLSYFELCRHFSEVFEIVFTLLKKFHNFLRAFPGTRFLLPCLYNVIVQFSRCSISVNIRLLCISTEIFFRLPLESQILILIHMSTNIHPSTQPLINCYFCRLRDSRAFRFIGRADRSPLSWWAQVGSNHRISFYRPCRRIP